MKIECNCVEKTAEELMKERNMSLEIIQIIVQINKTQKQKEMR